MSGVMFHSVVASSGEASGYAPLANVVITRSDY